MARKRLVTAEEAVLLHLLDYSKYSPEDEAPLELTQAGISRAIGVRRSHVSISLDAAISRGTVEENLSRVKGEKRKRKCYFLTGEGTATAREIKNSVSQTLVTSELPDGAAFRGPLEALVKKLNGKIRFAALALMVLEGKAKLPQLPDSEENPVIPSQIPKASPLYGRTEELALLSELFRGGVRIMTITGMPGIGKTSLAANAIASNSGSDAFWYNVTDWSNPRNACAHIASFLGARGSVRLSRYLQAHEIPDLGDIQDILIAEQLRAVIFFDDCQRASPSMQLFLSMLAKACAASPALGICLLGRHIPDAVATRPGSGRTAFLHISLKPIDTESSLALLRDRGIPENEAIQMARKGGGHPMYLCLAEGIAEAAGNDLTEVLAREIHATLSDSEINLLAQMSVYRAPVAHEALAETGDDIGALESLTARSLISRNPGWSIHSLISEFYYSRMPAGEREARHERAAEYYSNHDVSWSGQIEQIYHLFMARDYESASLGLTSRGEQLLVRGYADELLALCAMAPPEWKEQNDSFDIRLLEASAMDLMGRWDDAAEIYHFCISLATPDVEREVIVLRKLGAIEYRRGNLAEAGEMFRQALAVLPDGSKSLTAELHGSLGVVLWKTGETEAARKSYAIDLDISEDAKDRRGMARALNNLGLLDWQSGDNMAALEKYGRALSYAERLGDNRLTAILYSNMGDVHMSSGNLSDARRYYERCLQLAEDLKFNWQVAEAYRGLADIIPEKRGDYLSRALNIFDRLGAADDAKAVRKAMSSPPT